MVAPRYRSRTKKRIKVKLPGNRITIHYRIRAPAHPQCAGCGVVLSGVPRVKPRRLHSMSKTEKRPNRPYGGVFCSKCARKAILAKIKK